MSLQLLVLLAPRIHVVSEGAVATSNAIAYLGDTLVELLRDGLSGLVGSTNIFLSTPNEFKNFAPAEPSVTVFLYNIDVAGKIRNVPRRLSGGATPRLKLPIELHFLITPWRPLTRDAYVRKRARKKLLDARVGSRMSDAATHSTSLTALTRAASVSTITAAR
jgi:uncharacterized protein DUF4255